MPIYNCSAIYGNKSGSTIKQSGRGVAGAGNGSKVQIDNEVILNRLRKYERAPKGGSKLTEEVRHLCEVLILMSSAEELYNFLRTFNKWFMGDKGK